MRVKGCPSRCCADVLPDCDIGCGGLPLLTLLSIGGLCSRRLVAATQYSRSFGSLAVCSIIAHHRQADASFTIELECGLVPGRSQDHANSNWNTQPQLHGLNALETSCRPRNLAAVIPVLTLMAVYGIRTSIGGSAAALQCSVLVKVAEQCLSPLRKASRMCRSVLSENGPSAGQPSGLRNASAPRTCAPKASSHIRFSMLAERLLSCKQASSSRSSTGFAGICVADRSHLKVPLSARQPIAEQPTAAARTLAQLTRLWRRDRVTCLRPDLRERSARGTPATTRTGRVHAKQAGAARWQPAKAATFSAEQRTARQLGERADAARLGSSSVRAAADTAARPWRQINRWRDRRGSETTRCR